MTTPYYTYEEVQREAAHRSETHERNLLRGATVGILLGAGLTFGGVIAEAHEAAAPANAAQTWADTPKDRVAMARDSDPENSPLVTATTAAPGTSQEGASVSDFAVYGGMASLAIGAAVGGTGMYLQRRRECESA